LTLLLYDFHGLSGLEQAGKILGYKA